MIQSLSHKRIRFTAALSALLLAVLLPLSGCGVRTVENAVFTFPLSGEPAQLDPQLCTDKTGMQVLSSLFDGLVTVDAQGKVAAGAAASWQVSADGLTYTFTLGNSTFSDGNRVTAADFVFGIRRAALPSTKSPYAADLAGLRGYDKVRGGGDLSALGAEAVDDATLRLTLSKADAMFLYTLTSPVFYPCREAFFAETGGRYGLETDYVMGNGPMMLASWTHGELLRLEKNEKYTGSRTVKPAAVRYLLSTIDDPVGSLTGGALDAAELPPEQVAQAKEDGHTVAELADTITMLWFNNRSQLLSDAHARTALRAAVDWDTIVGQIERMGYRQAAGPVSPAAVVSASDTAAYRRDENAKWPVSDAEAARSNWSAALSAASLQKAPTFTVLCAEDENSQQLARYIVQSWQKYLTVFCEVKPLDKETLQTRISVGNYQIAIGSFTPSGETAAAALSAFSTGGTGNYAGLSDGGFDAACEQALYAGDRQTAEQLEARFTALCPAVPLYVSPRYVGVVEKAQGLVVRPFYGGTYGVTFDFSQAVKTK